MNSGHLPGLSVNRTSEIFNNNRTLKALFQKYSRRKGQPAFDYASLLRRQVELLMPFPKFELLEHTIPLLSLMLFCPRSACFSRFTDYSDYDPGFGKFGKALHCDARSIV